MAKGAKVFVSDLNEKGKKDVSELLGTYIELLESDGQESEATLLKGLLPNLEDHFVQVLPEKEQADPSVSTE
jgi:glutamate synthase (NADPH) large chain